MTADQAAPDPAAILTALGIRDADAVRPITTGFGDTAVFKVDRGGRSFALRVFPVGRPDLLDREQAAMDAAAAGGVPVPALEGRGEWAERPVALSTWVAGRTMADELRRRPWLAFRLGRRLGQVQARIHAAPVSDDLRGVAPDWVGRVGPAETRLATAVRRLGQGKSLLHLDLHPDNVMVEGGRVTGVLDWANVSVGDPRLDWARTWSILRLAPLPPGALNRFARPILGLLAEGWRRGYAEAAGTPSDLPLFQTWAVAVMIADLEPKLARPGVWLRPEDIARLRQERSRLG